MNPQISKPGFDSDSPPCPGLEYINLPTHAGEMRYHPDSNTSSLTIEPAQPSPLLNLYHPPILNSSAPYPQDGGAFYQPAPSLFPGVDIRSRLGSNTSQAGMAHSQPPRNTTLPHPGPPALSARDQYTSTTPSYRRSSQHSRSPSFPGANLRRHPLSPTSTGVRMDTNQYSNRSQQNTIPPLQQLQSLGHLQYADGQNAKVEIAGTIDKGFFLSDGEWTCYRRNYFSCVCSFSITPNFPDAQVQFVPANSTQSMHVYGFAMSISAVVSDNDAHSIELVQHTPKRDKGPIMRPEKVRMAPKPQPANHHLGMFQDTVGGSRSLFTETYNLQANNQQCPTEHTFERIQFKQATQNNGKRRAAQQYYQLVVELWADLGNHNHNSEQFVKVAFRKSSKMIVRGRSPGHCQNERRGSQSSGPGGSSGLGNYGSNGGIGDFPSNPMMGSGGYSGGFDGRGNIYGVRHHDMPSAAMMSPDEAKVMEEAKGYQYYPGPMYEGHGDRIPMFHNRNQADGATLPHMATGVDLVGRVKSEYDGTVLPSIFQPPALVSNRRSGLFEGKSTTSGYYPVAISAPKVNMTMS